MFSTLFIYMKAYGKVYCTDTVQNVSTYEIG
jgi:hypothetical protein